MSDDDWAPSILNFVCCSQWPEPRTVQKRPAAATRSLTPKRFATIVALVRSVWRVLEILDLGFGQRQKDVKEKTINDL